MRDVSVNDIITFDHSSEIEVALSKEIRFVLINELFPVSGDEQEVQLRRRELQEGAGPAGSHARPGQVRRVRGEGGGAGRGGRGDAAPRARHPAVPRLSRQLLQVIQ